MGVLLRTDRLVLRRFTSADVENLVALDADPAVIHYITGGRPTPREEVVQSVLPTFLDFHRRHDRLGFFAAERLPSPPEPGVGPSQSTFVGWFELRPLRDEPPDVVELGYRLVRSAWGVGLATEGARALVTLAFAELGVERVQASTMAVNVASRRVMEKAGLRFVRTFHQEWPVRIPGDEHGDVEYALTRDEWQHGRRAP